MKWLRYVFGCHHRRVYWPIHGHTICRDCLRAIPVLTKGGIIKPPRRTQEAGPRPSQFLMSGIERREIETLYEQDYRGSSS